MSGALPGIPVPTAVALVAWAGSAPTEALSLAAIAAALQTTLVAGVLLLAERATRSRWPALGPGLVTLALAKFAVPFGIAWACLPAAPAGAVAPLPLSTAPASVPAEALAISRPWVAAAALWAMGSLIALARIGRARWRLSRRLRATRACDDPAMLGTLDRVSRLAGLRTAPALRLSDHDPALFVAGTVTPRIVIPAGWLASLSPGDLEAVLLHEVVHVRRGDVLKLEVAALLGAWWWWNPVQRLAAARWRATIEDRCDDAVLSLLRGGPEAYGRSLLRAARLTVPARPALGAGTAGLGAHDVERRLRRMFERDRAPGGVARKLALAVLAAAAVVVLPFVGHAPAAEPRTADPSHATSAASPESHAARHARLHAQRHAAHIHAIPIAP